MAAIDDFLSAALGHYFAGRWREASSAFVDVLAIDPSHALAWHFLGLVALQQGRCDMAAGLIQKSLELSPEYAQAHHDLGACWKVQGKLTNAAACYLRSIELEPGHADAYFDLGTVLEMLGGLPEALDRYSTAIALNPRHAEAHNALGCGLLKLHQLDQAIGHFQCAIDLQPDLAAAHHNLGAALHALGNAEDAVGSFRQALERMPDSVESRIGLGAALQMAGQPDEASECYRAALLARPNDAVAHNNLGNALKDQGLLTPGIESFRRATAIQPDFISAHSNLLYALNFCPGVDSAAIHEEHRRWAVQHAEPLANSSLRHANDASPNRRLRIGFVSPDFGNHCQSFFTTPLFAAHDGEQYEFHCYSDVARPDAMTARLRSSVEHWRDVASLADEQLAQVVRDDRIDILVDLTMHMTRGRPLLFARKPAPVQVCWLAYPGTTGQTGIDYRLTDPYLDPADDDLRFYSETSWRLPDSFWCYDPLEVNLAISALPAAKNAHITFGSLNNFCKTNDAVFQLWSEVLRRVDRSRLILLAPLGSHRSHVIELFRQAGIEPQRIEFVGKQSLQRYFSLYHQIDIGLDTLPYNGHTTSLDAYWMGVPVITLAGETVVGRAGVSQLTNLELTELIARTPDQFVQKAVELATDIDRLAMLRASLRERMRFSPLMDAQRFARSMEAAFRGMWQQSFAARA